MSKAINEIYDVRSRTQKLHHIKSPGNLCFRGIFYCLLMPCHWPRRPDLLQGRDMDGLVNRKKKTDRTNKSTGPRHAQAAEEAESRGPAASSRRDISPAKKLEKSVDKSTQI